MIGGEGQCRLSIELVDSNKSRNRNTIRNDTRKTISKDNNALSPLPELTLLVDVNY